MTAAGLFAATGFNFELAQLAGKGETRQSSEKIQFSFDPTFLSPESSPGESMVQRAGGLNSVITL